MILMPDDEPELSLPAAVLPPGEEFLPALSSENAPVSPARAYLLSLNSPRSRQTMASFLNIVAGMLGATSLESCNWGSLRRHHVMAVTELLRDTGRATATVNTYLSALKGVAKEAWMLRLMDVESFQHIRAVRNLRGSRLPRGRALPPEEIRTVFGACESDDSSIGIRDAAMLAVILGCGLRRSEAVGWIFVTLSHLSGHSGCLVRETKSGWLICRRALGNGSGCGSMRCGEKKTGHCSHVSAASTP